MANELVKRMVKKDGSQRISFYRDEYAENPRNMTDEPLHCEDWSREYSIMTKQERESKSSNARDCCEYLLGNFGDHKKIVKELIDEGKIKGAKELNNQLVYDKHEHEWVLEECTRWFGEKDYTWRTAETFACRKDELDQYIWEILESLCDSTIDYLCKACMTDKVKIMSYGFGYNGDISFYHEFSTDSEGICWLEKDEFLKYSGHKEEYWNGKSLDEIEWLLDELKAWGDNDVYGFIVEDCIKSVIHKEYTNSDRDDECYEHEDWEESDSCWGYYGDIDEVKVSMFDQAGLDINEFEEENV